MQKRVNLIPQQPLADKIKAIIPVVMLTLGLLIVLFFSFRVQGLNDELVRLTKQIDQAEHLAVELRTQKDKINLNQTRLANRKKEKEQRHALVTTLAKLKGSKHHFAQPIAIIAQSLPPTIRCQSLNFTGKSGIMTGTALDYDDLTQVVIILQTQPLFTQVDLTVTDRDNNQELERIAFTITMQLT